MLILHFLKSHRSIVGILLFSLVLCGVNSTICRAEQYLVGSYNSDGKPVQLVVPTDSQPLKAVLATATNQTYQTQKINIPYADGRYLLQALSDLGLDDEFSVSVSDTTFFPNYYVYSFTNPYGSSGSPYYLYSLVINKSSCFSDYYDLTGITGTQGYYTYPFTSIVPLPYSLGSGTFGYRFLPFFKSPYLVSETTSFISVSDYTGNKVSSFSQFIGVSNHYYYDSSSSILCPYYNTSSSYAFTLTDFSQAFSLFLSSSADVLYLFFTVDISSGSLSFVPCSAWFGVPANIYSTLSYNFNIFPLASCFRDFDVNNLYYALQKNGSSYEYGVKVGGTNGVDLERYFLVPFSYSLLSANHVGPYPTLTPTPFPTFAPWDPEDPSGGTTPTPIPTNPWRDSSLPTPTPFPSYSVPVVSVTPIPQYLNPDSPISSQDAISGLDGYLNIIDSTFGNFDIFFIGSQILSYFYSFSPYFSFVLLIPAICLIAFVIGRLNQK